MWALPNPQVREKKRSRQRRLLGSESKVGGSGEGGVQEAWRRNCAKEKSDQLC